MKRLVPRRLFRIIEPIGHGIEATLISWRYGRPAGHMRVIAITGTNGKTTTAYMIHRMLREAGYDVALMTTVAYGVNDDIKPQIAHMTTVSAPQLNKRLAEFRNAGATWLVLEVTSHALAQHRINGVPIEVAVLTNITHEHLDYHGTFARYLAAKRRLFELAARHPHGHGIINADDPNADAFVAAAPSHTSYGLEKGALRAYDIDAAADKSNYTARIGDETYHITCHIPGQFNIANSLAAIAVGRHIGLSRTQIEQGIAALDHVEGRMSTVDAGQAFAVVIDFAHTPDSFERLLSDLRASTDGKLIALFGSAGRRDEAKRSAQGEIAGKYCDELVLTEEDDRDIDGQLILDQIASGAEQSGKLRDRDMFIVPDRTEAIRVALSRASSPDDCVVLLGKGHEKTIERADGVYPWDEASEVRAAIKAQLARRT
ncbi:hypothetical protein CR983_04320 [Candidatus Saccharibacteria bacterium]|nr:MAG: hypothetical protein CR983_04320 [Candidatus Saccharibacteria bacterium]